MLGLPAHAGVGAPDEWLDRVHPDDARGAERARSKAHLARLDRGVPARAPHPARGRHLPAVPLPRRRGRAAPGRKPARIAGSLTDTTEQAIAQERLRSVGFLDPLTGLCNRADFVERLGRAARRVQAAARGRRRSRVLYLDLDRFKIVNDSLGHLVGDELLIAASRRLESCLRQGDVAGAARRRRVRDPAERARRRAARRTRSRAASRTR